MVEIISKAIAKGQAVLSEYDSKQIIAAAGLAVNREKLVRTREDAVRAAEEIGYPVVLKGCSDQAAHKTEMGLVKLNLGNAEDVAQAYDEITAKGIELDGVLVGE